MKGKASPTETNRTAAHHFPLYLPQILTPYLYRNATTGRKRDRYKILCKKVSLATQFGTINLHGV